MRKTRSFFLWESAPEQPAAPGSFGFAGADRITVTIPPAKTVSPEERLLTSPHLRPSIALSEFGKLLTGWRRAAHSKAKRIGPFRIIEKDPILYFYCRMVIVNVCLPKASAAFKSSMCKSILLPTIAPPVSPAIAMP